MGTVVAPRRGVVVIPRFRLLDFSLLGWSGDLLFILFESFGLGSGPFSLSELQGPRSFTYYVICWNFTVIVHQTP